MAKLLKADDAVVSVPVLKFRYREIVLELADACDLTPSKTEKLLDMFMSRLDEISQAGGKLNMLERGVIKGRKNEDGVVSLRWIPAKSEKTDS